MKALQTIFWSLLVVCMACLLWFIFDKEHSRATTRVYDSVSTFSEYETRRGNKGVILINRDCEIDWREYDDGIMVRITFTKPTKL